MAAIPTLVVTPSAAAAAYARTDAAGAADAPIGQGFTATLDRAVQTAIDTGNKAEALSVQGIAGGGDITKVVTAVAQAQLTLQTATVIRDRVVQAYQDIMKMPI